MKKILLMNEFKKVLENCDEVSEEDMLIRQLINISSKKCISEEDLHFIEKIDYKIFLKAYEELSKNDLLEMKLVQDMSLTEYGKDNLIYADIFDDCEDVY